MRPALIHLEASAAPAERITLEILIEDVLVKVLEKTRPKEKKKVVTLSLCVFRH